MYVTFSRKGFIQKDNFLSFSIIFYRYYIIRLISEKSCFSTPAASLIYQLRKIIN